MRINPWEKGGEKEADNLSVALKWMSPKIYYGLEICLILGVGFLVYANSLKNEFVWDDKGLIENPFIKDWRNLALVFTSHFWAHYKDVLQEALYYRPLIILSFMSDYLLWGLNPFGYHLTNIIFHLLNSLLIFILFQSLFQDRLLSLFSGLFFALHPVHTESVTFISGRTDVISTFFLLSSLFCYHKFTKSYSHPCLFLFLSLFFFLAALLAKEVAVVLPLLILLYELVFPQGQKRGKGWTPLIIPYIPFLLCLLFYLGLRWAFLPSEAGLNAADLADLYPRILTMFQIIFSYIKILFFPFLMKMLYLSPFSHSISDPRVLISIILCLLILTINFIMRKRSKAIFFAISWFLITILPVSGLLPIRGAIIANRFLYLPSVGFCLLLASFLPQILRISTKVAPTRVVRQAIFSGIGFTILAPYTIMTIQQNRLWRDEIALYSEQVKVAPNSARAQANLGYAYYNKGEIHEAIKHIKMALKIDPSEPWANFNLGNACLEIGLLDEAERHYKEALKRKIMYKAFINLGIIYGQKGKFREAVNEFNHALRINPRDPIIYLNLANTYHLSGQDDLAIKEYEKALELEPAFPEAYYNLGIIYGNKNQMDKAITQFKRALQLSPSSPDIYYNLGIAYKKKGLHTLAIKEFRKVIELRPNDLGAQQQLKSYYKRKR